MGAKVWTTTLTGFKVHSFTDGRADCRKNFKQGPGRVFDHADARNWVLSTPGLSFCDTCEKVTRVQTDAIGTDLADNDDKETDNVSIKEGPLTERQVRIIERLLQGKRHEEIARTLSTPDETISLAVVRMEAQNIAVKFKARTVLQAAHIYSEARAYREAARDLLKARVPVPMDEGDVHANHVLEGIAELYQSRYDQWMPR